MSPFVLAPTELAVVDFEGLVRTANYLTAAQHILQHDPSTEFVPFIHGCATDGDKMATKQLIGTISFPNNSQIFELQTGDKCSNCVKMEEKLASALIDLKTAETIISILSADLKLNSELCASDETNLNLAKWS
jgi:hypothetical protein